MIIAEQEAYESYRDALDKCIDISKCLTSMQEAGATSEELHSLNAEFMCAAREREERRADWLRVRDNLFNWRAA